jgi:hypothetical protein
MRTPFLEVRAVCAAIALAALTACSSSPPQSKYQQEMFDTGVSQYSRAYNASSADACEAARRTLLNQGYVTNATHPDSVDATKDFQPDGDKHFQVEFHVVCVPGEETSDTSIIYANAVQNGFALKKTDTSASVGLSIIGSVSLPIRSNSDEMVKVSSETIQSDKFYGRFFDFVGHNLNTVVKKANSVKAAAVSSTVIPPSPPVATTAPPVAAPAPVTPVALPVSASTGAPVAAAALTPAPLVAVPATSASAPAATAAPASSPIAPLADAVKTPTAAPSPAAVPAAAPAAPSAP